MTGGATPIRDANKLLNQWALDASGRIVHASLCAIGVAYRCPLPGCGQETRVRAEDSEHVRPHLYHSETCAASRESREHQLAKQVVAQRLRDWLAGEKPAPFIGALCQTHQVVIDVFGALEGASLIEVEGAVGTRRADVLVHRGAAPPFAIEVHFSHAVDEDKAGYLATLNVGWIELDAEQVIAGNPWVYIAGSAPVPPCPLCSLARATQDERAKLSAAQAEATKQAVLTAQATQARQDAFARTREAEATAARTERETTTAIRACEERSAFAVLRASRVEEESQFRIDVILNRVREIEPRRCSLCGIVIPWDADESSHPVNFGILYPHERDRYRAVHEPGRFEAAE